MAVWRDNGNPLAAPRCIDCGAQKQAAEHDGPNGHDAGDAGASAPGARSDVHQAWPPTDTRGSRHGLSAGARSERSWLLF